MPAAYAPFLGIEVVGTVAYVLDKSQRNLPVGEQDNAARSSLRKDNSWNPIELVRSPGWITLAALAVVLLVLVLAVLLLRRLLRPAGRRRGYQGYRGRRWRRR